MPAAGGELRAAALRQLRWTELDSQGSMIYVLGAWQLRHSSNRCLFLCTTGAYRDCTAATATVERHSVPIISHRTNCAQPTV